MVLVKKYMYRIQNNPWVKTLNHGNLTHWHKIKQGISGSCNLMNMLGGKDKRITLSDIQMVLFSENYIYTILDN